MAQKMQRIISFRNILVTLVFCFTTLVIFVKQLDYFGFDLKITQFIQNINFPGFETSMVLVSKLGDASIGGVSILIFASIAVLVKKWKTACMILVTIFTMTILNQTLKHLIGRPRPDLNLVRVIGSFSKYDSFPSGHVMFVVGLYGFLLFLVYTQFQRQHILRPVLLTLFGIVIILIGVSRIYLGAHWFSDVLGAYLLGFSWLMVMIWVYDKISPRVLK